LWIKDKQRKSIGIFMQDALITFLESVNNNIGTAVLSAYLECNGIEADDKEVSLALQEGKVAEFLKKAGVAGAIAGTMALAAHNDKADIEKINAGFGSGKPTTEISVDVNAKK
jgi:hypothetical protein